jgi:hypothetical protein
MAAFASSYIKTVASQVTRAADSASMTGTNFSDWYNSSAGTFYAETAKFGFGTNAILAVSAGASYSTGNGMLLRNAGVQIQAGGNGSTVNINAPTEGDFNKVVFNYQVTGASSNTLTMVFNSGSPATLSTLDYNGFATTTLVIGALTTNGVQQGNRFIKKIAYYPQRLTNTQLQALTS